MLLEICIDSPRDAVAAERGGAGRVELCADLVRGGTTPSAGTIAVVRDRVTIPVVVLVRPRAGDFAYDASELDAMLHDVALAKSLGADGIATGALTSDGRVDADAMRRLLDAARPMAVTFHRAFDLAGDPGEALDALLALGVDRVLTSGQVPTALDGAATIARLVRRAGDALSVMAGGRVTADRAGEIVRATGVRELHARPTARVESAMTVRRDGIVFGKAYAPDEYAWTEVSEAGVRDLASAIARPR